jgi:hypothetical protein
MRDKHPRHKRPRADATLCNTLCSSEYLQITEKYSLFAYSSNVVEILFPNVVVLLLPPLLALLPVLLLRPSHSLLLLLSFAASSNPPPCPLPLTPYPYCMRSVLEQPSPLGLARSPTEGARLLKLRMQYGYGVSWRGQGGGLEEEEKERMSKRDVVVVYHAQEWQEASYFVAEESQCQESMHPASFPSPPPPPAPRSPPPPPPPPTPPPPPPPPLPPHPPLLHPRCPPPLSKRVLQSPTSASESKPRGVWSNLRVRGRSVTEPY